MRMKLRYALVTALLLMGAGCTKAEPVIPDRPTTDTVTNATTTVEIPPNVRIIESPTSTILVPEPVWPNTDSDGKG
jgi:hypothetical protein